MNNPNEIDHHDEQQEEILFPSNEEEANDIHEMDDARLMDEREDHFRDDVEADADALASAGWGTDEDYNGGCFNDME